MRTASDQRACLLWEPQGSIDHMEVAVSDNSYVLFSFEQRKKGKETAPLVGIIQGSRRKLDVDLG